MHGYLPVWLDDGGAGGCGRGEKNESCQVLENVLRHRKCIGVLER